MPEEVRERDRAEHGADAQTNVLERPERQVRTGQLAGDVLAPGTPLDGAVERRHRGRLADQLSRTIAVVRAAGRPRPAR